MNIIRTFFITIFPLSIICTHYDIDGFFYWFILMLAYVITYFVGDTIFTPIYMIWTLVLLRFRITPIALVYYIVCFVYFYTFFISMKEKRKNHSHEDNTEYASNSQKNNGQHRNIGGYLILLVFSLSITGAFIASYKASEDTETKSISSISSSPSHTAAASVPTKDVATPMPTKKPQSYDLKNIKTLYKKIQRYPRKYNNSIISVSGYASFIGYNGDEGNSFVITAKKHEDDSLAWLDFEEIYDKNDCLYIAEYSLDTFPRVLNKDKVRIKGIISTVYDSEKGDYMAIMNNPISIKINNMVTH